MLQTSRESKPEEPARDEVAGTRVSDVPAAQLNTTFGERDAAWLETRAIRVRVGGRITFKRVMGKAGFAKIDDRSGQLQLLLPRSTSGPAYEAFKGLDVGDVVTAEGILFRTKAGDLSVRVEKLPLLEKSPRPKASPIDQTTAELLRKTTHAALAALTPREAKVLRKRFGIDMSTDHTLEKVGKQFDITRDRIRLQERAHLSSLTAPATLSFPRAPSPRVLDQFLTRVRCLPWDEMAATHFASIAVELHRSRIPIGSMDTMIAGHAIAVRAVLVTSNERHFARVPGLNIENWT
jgi:predicted nucleic acid-binding protein